MITALKRLFTTNAYVHKDVGATQPSMLPQTSIPNGSVTFKKMTLQDRMAWRVDMLHKAVRETCNHIGVLSGSYQYKIFHVDDRAHYFVVTMDLSSQFSKQVRGVKNLGDIEAMLSKMVYDKYGIVISGVFWRTATLTAMPSRPIETVPVLRETVVYPEVTDFADTEISTRPPIDLRAHIRPHFDPVSKEEEAAFMEAMQAGIKPPPLHIGKQEYVTDLAPLGPN